MAQYQDDAFIELDWDDGLFYIVEVRHIREITIAGQLCVVRSITTHADIHHTVALNLTPIINPYISYLVIREVTDLMIDIGEGSLHNS